MDGKRKGLLVALAIGLVAAPALALAASGLLGGQAKAGEPAGTAAAAATSSGAPAVVTTTAADLELACTTEGAGLVAREAAGMLSDLQQAALDALRPICEAEGFPLATTPAAGEIPSAAAVAPTTTTVPATQFDDDGGEAEQEDEVEHEDENDSDQDEVDDHEDEN